MLASHALLMLGVPLRRVLHRVQDARGERYAALRGQFHALLRQPGRRRTHERAPALSGAGRRCDAHRQGAARCGLHEVGAEITAIRRSKSRIEISPETVFRGGDIVVLRGATEAIALAEERLLRA